MSDLDKLPLTAAGCLPAGAVMNPIDPQGQPLRPLQLFSADPTVIKGRTNLIYPRIALPLC
jgi:hypothetical protein